MTGTTNMRELCYFIAFLGCTLGVTFVFLVPRAYKNVVDWLPDDLLELLGMDKAAKIIVIVVQVVFGLMAAASQLMMIGIYFDKAWLFVPHLVFTLLFFVIATVGFLINNIEGILNNGFMMRLAATIVIFVEYTLVAFVFPFCLCRQIRKEKKLAARTS